VIDQPSFFPQFDAPAPRTVAPASRKAFERIEPTLTEREIEIFILVADYLEQTKQPDVTGGELAEWSGKDKTTIRPRLTGLHAKKWLQSWHMRPSRARLEGACHPYSLAVPRSAIERVKAEVTSQKERG